MKCRPYENGEVPYKAEQIQRGEVWDWARDGRKDAAAPTGRGPAPSCSLLFGSAGCTLESGRMEQQQQQKQEYQANRSATETSVALQFHVGFRLYPQQNAWNAKMFYGTPPDTKQSAENFRECRFSDFQKRPIFLNFSKTHATISLPGHRASRVHFLLQLIEIDGKEISLRCGIAAGNDAAGITKENEKGIRVKVKESFSVVAGGEVVVVVVVVALPPLLPSWEEKKRILEKAEEAPQR
ncbi:unnamed protein product [Gongylonema pulchrum]|uniref:FHA domain-containing protein n=1 Tax=Gongylonema pulchrum TaxID=637853 RepID=A0A183CYF7_9BILA|nr:unnamed protein product [Gongylonema pulchrum]